MTPDEITKEAFARLHSWKEQKPELFLTFSFTGQSRPLEIVVKVFDIHDDHSSLTLSWLKQADDPADGFVFIKTEGYFGVFLQGATFAIANNPKPSITISRGPFTCKLDENIPSA